MNQIEVIHVRNDNLVWHTRLGELANLHVKIAGADKTTSSSLFGAQFLIQEVCWRVKLVKHHSVGSLILIVADYHFLARSIAAGLIVGTVLSVTKLLLMKNRFSLVDKLLSTSLVTCFEFDLVSVRCTEDIQTFIAGDCFHFRANKGLATVKMELRRILAVSLK